MGLCSLTALLEPTTLLVGVGALLFTKWLLSEPPNLPPGPTRWPFIGCIPSATNYPMEKGYYFMLENAKKYGGIFTLKFGAMVMIVMADPKVVKECYGTQGANFSGRDTESKQMKEAKQKYGEHGIFNAENDSWKDIRRFALHALRDLGVGKKTIEGRIQEEMTALQHEIGAKRAKAFDPFEVINMAVSNIICSVCFGERCDYADKDFQEQTALIKKQGGVATIMDFGMIFPILRFLPNWLRFDRNHKKREVIFKLMDDLDELIGKKIDDHRSSFDENDIRDLVDLYLEREKERDDKTITAIRMRRIIYDLFFAGTDTTSMSITWALLYMITYPEVQVKCQQEIDTVIGEGQLPSLQHRSKMPYIEATLHEILRMACIVPLNLPHFSKEAATVAGYTIPAKTTVAFSVYAIHRNEKHFPEPDTFKPERFLDEEGKFVRSDNFLAFGAGPRICLGEQLAWSEMFLFFTGMLQRFTFKKESREAKLVLEGIQGLTMAPPSFQLVAEERI